MILLKGRKLILSAAVLCLCAAVESGCGGGSEDTAISEIGEDISSDNVVEETAQPEETTVDVGDYLDSYEDLVDILNMEQTESWQFSVDTSYEADGFYLEWNGDESYEFSMKNEGNEDVLVFGLSIGEDIKDTPEALSAAGWAQFWEGDSGYVYIRAFDDGYYYLDLEGDADGRLDNWYLNNWPEGDLDLDSVWHEAMDDE